MAHNMVIAPAPGNLMPLGSSRGTCMCMYVYVHVYSLCRHRYLHIDKNNENKSLEEKCMTIGREHVGNTGVVGGRRWIWF